MARYAARCLKAPRNNNSNGHPHEHTVSIARTAGQGGTDLAASPAFVAVAALRRDAHAVNPSECVSRLSGPGRQDH